MLLRHHLVLCGVLLCSLASAVSAQRPTGTAPPGDAGRARVPQNGPAPAAEPRLSSEMEQLLERWASASARIERLEGEHLRRVYDSVFEVEKLSEGRFWYEAPDKGRIDVTPTKITQEMVDARQAPDAPVRRGKNGQPYELIPDQPEKWICDGIRVFEIDEEKQTALVGQLPPDMQGVSIMDSPLPFLFGMPPEKAKQRFRLSFSKPYDPRSPAVYIRAYPRLEQDASSWSRADVILDQRTFLPVAIQLIDTAGTGTTVYSFRNLEPNKGSFLKLPAIWGNNIFRPDLREYQVNVIQGGPNGRIADRNAPPGNGGTGSLGPVVPNLKGIPFGDAVDALEKMGLSRTNKTILLNKGPVARQPGDVYRVQSQDPAAGTPLGKDTRVTLILWTKPGDG